jgi:myo-inositol-1(or 4)-monophosphatase
VPIWQIDSIINLLTEAGEIALRHYAQPGAELKPDHSLVTLADTEIETFLKEKLSALGDNVLVLGEETGLSGLDADLGRPLFIVDPIDGTAPYAHHLPNWGISIGYAENGVLVEGAVYLPVVDELYISEGDAVYLCELRNGRRQRLTPPDQTFTDGSMIAISQEIVKRGSLRMRNPMLAVCCAVVPLTGLLLGRCSAYVTCLKIWDIAGSLPMLAKLGIHPVGFDGLPFDLRVHEDNYHLDPAHPKRWRQHRPCFFAHDDARPAILAALEWPTDWT